MLLRKSLESWGKNSLSLRGNVTDERFVRRFSQQVPQLHHQISSSKSRTVVQSHANLRQRSRRSVSISLPNVSTFDRTSLAGEPSWRRVTVLPKTNPQDVQGTGSSPSLSTTTISTAAALTTGTNSRMSVTTHRMTTSAVTAMSYTHEGTILFSAVHFSSSTSPDYTTGNEERTSSFNTHIDYQSSTNSDKATSMSTGDDGTDVLDDLLLP